MLISISNAALMTPDDYCKGYTKCKTEIASASAICEQDNGDATKACKATTNPTCASIDNAYECMIATQTTAGNFCQWDNTGHCKLANSGDKDPLPKYYADEATCETIRVADWDTTCKKHEGAEDAEHACPFLVDVDRTGDQIAIRTQCLALADLGVKCESKVDSQDKQICANKPTSNSLSYYGGAALVAIISLVM